ncbi:uncharacterized protein LOC133732661 isoform X2 [Rosa rugosa]|uniref:uncharacterized protein LOC133732661 isoform X2 n=1 Tax=Rosa rugosa TaxID=74645 RepID=UPI002B413EA9|nr:uncharacterized protein LOC133732661 isoform X2 [Rosa rugosa]
MKKMWQELDILDPLSLKCADYIAVATERTSKHRVYMFLAGLDPHLDSVRSRVLNTKPLPKIEEAYSIVSAEANRLKTMMSGPTTEGSAMMAKYKPPHTSGSKFAPDSGPSWRKPQGPMYCTHCKSTKHNIDSCYQLIGYPEWWDAHIAKLKDTKAKEIAATPKNATGPKPRGKAKASLQVVSPDSEVNLVCVASEDDTSGHPDPPFAFMTDSGHPHRGDNWSWC